ncbi:MAG: regulatory protein RecX, partial [Planctomycetota bacterium]
MPPLFPDQPEARREAAAQSIRDVGQPGGLPCGTKKSAAASGGAVSEGTASGGTASGGGGGARISALRPTHRDPHRSTVKVDGRAMGTLSQKLIDDLGLVIGSPWTPQLADAVAEAVVYDKAFRAATRRLARRAMSSGMIRQKLRTPPRPRKRPREPGKDGKPREPTPIPPAHVIDQVIARLTELDLLDDRAFGEALIRDLTRSKPAGPMLLKQKLYAKGLDRTLIDELVAAATADPEQQADGATAFARKKIRSMRHLEPDAQKRR